MSKVLGEFSMLALMGMDALRLAYRETSQNA